MSSPARPHGRGPNQLRPLTIELGPLKFADGSAQIELGDTRVLVAASVENRVPPFLSGSGRGWITAEYSMLPRATPTRSAREVTRGRPSGRTSEIQRLIGRALRSVVDLERLGERTLTLDCDVIQADGGTRTASISAAYVAMVQALGGLVLRGDLTVWPIERRVAAISVGVLGGHALLDLEYVEDRDAEVDMNVVATDGGLLVEVQGTGEERAFARQELDRLIDLALDGIAMIGEVQEATLRSVTEEVAAATAGRRSSAPAKSEADLWDRP